MGRVPQPSRTGSLRRTPVQRRSAERLARILDACAELLDETGYEALSTRAVAVRAGVPIGSVYRFFADKRAMAAALARRNLDGYAERVAARLAALPEPPEVPSVPVEGAAPGAVPGVWAGGAPDAAPRASAGAPPDAYAAVDAVLDEYLAMKRTVPGFALVDFGVPAPAGPGGDDEPNHLVADRLCGLLATHLRRPPDRPLDVVMRRKVLVAVEAADALLRLAFRADPAGDPALIAETRALLHAYLGPVLA
ncbi:TetR/AcrR family transcriptional regulator [Streptomyces sp. NPDC045431]|uniref:TetR/AcrR family transcriptional regulator n=1 Tax=Streptomyces sp. NPDC045431 TaxID=3155613 RepID=UPI00340EA6CB